MPRSKKRLACHRRMGATHHYHCISPALRPPHLYPAFPYRGVITVMATTSMRRFVYASFLKVAFFFFFFRMKAPSSGGIVGLPNAVAAFVPTRNTVRSNSNNRNHSGNKQLHSVAFSPERRSLLFAASFFSSLFPGNEKANQKVDLSKIQPAVPSHVGPTNQVIRKVQGIRHKRLGGTDIVVSEIGLGTQRWVSADFNAPDTAQVYEFMDRAILQGGVNLIDTAEQYPIPSDGTTAREGDGEVVIGKWLQSRKVPRDKVVIATKITGGRNVTPQNIRRDCADSLRRLQTDYIDVYQLHWPQRYSPQSNWGQSLEYNLQRDTSPYWRQNGGPTTVEDLCYAMEELIQQGKIRGWGLCNDNAYGLTSCTRTAKALGTTPPCTLQGDYSLLDRKSDENGVAEAASPYNENVGFMAYNALAGGMLTGKYMMVPAALDDLGNRDRAMASINQPRGRMDTRGWGGTLYRYRTDAALDGIRQYDALARQAGMSLTELSLRWCKERTLLTTTLVGHSNLRQLEESLKYFSIDEPLPLDLLWEIDRVHMQNRLPLFSNTRVGSDWKGEGEIGETIP